MLLEGGRVNAKSFNALVQQRISLIVSILESKNEEYSGDDSDRLHNFKVSARMDGCSPEYALWHMLLKHLTSVQDMVHATEKRAVHHPLELINQKLGDSINYLILLEGLMKERLSKQRVEVPPEIARAAARVRGAQMTGRTVQLEGEAPAARKPRRKGARKPMKKKMTRRQGPRKKRK